MNSKERVLSSLNHRTPDRVAVDFGSTAVTGIHCSIVEKLREHYGLERRPVKVHEPYQMLGWVDDDLRDAMGIDTVGFMPFRTLLGYGNEAWKPWRTPWGQDVLMSVHFEYDERPDGLVAYPEGDRSAAPSAHMPNGGYFFDAIIRQQEIDEDNLRIEDNLEEFGPMSAEEAAHWRSETERLRGSTRAVVVNLGGTALGDIALVPAPYAKNPSGIRDVALWYMTVAANPDFVQKLFDRQLEIAFANLEKYREIVGDVPDVSVVCGTDFGTQEGTFCSVSTFDEIWRHRYRRMNDWIHANTNWKTFKHSCGAIESILSGLIAAGFDIVNPVQCSAKGMDPETLKSRYGKDLTFWGGGVNTQRTLPFGTPEEVRAEVAERCRIFAPGGGFVFNAIHNVQALTPIENVVAMIEAVREM